jgi:hypothetical protein
MASHWLAGAVRAVERGAELLNAFQKIGEVCLRHSSQHQGPAGGGMFPECSLNVP